MKNNYFKAIVVKSEVDISFSKKHRTSYDVYYGFMFDKKYYPSIPKKLIEDIVNNAENNCVRHTVYTEGELLLFLNQSLGLKNDSQYVVVDKSKLDIKPNKAIKMKRQKASRWYPPTEATEGVVGEFFYCTKDKKVYTCVDVKYKWIEFDDRTRKDLLEEIDELRGLLDGKVIHK